MHAEKLIPEPTFGLLMVGPQIFAREESFYINLNNNIITLIYIVSGMRIRIRSDPLIFGPPDPVLFSLDPDPTCNNGFIKLFSSWTKYNPELKSSIIKWWFIISNFMPTYQRYKYIFFFISISGRIRNRSRNIFPAEPDPDPWKKMSDPHPWVIPDL